MSRHTARRVLSTRALRGFGGAFDLGLTLPGGGVPISDSVQQSEMAVTGTFEARAGTLLNEASKYMTAGLVTTPYQMYAGGEVVGGPGTGAEPAGWSPDPSTWGSPMDAVAGAERAASDANQRAIDNNLDPSVTTGPSAPVIDGTVYVTDDPSLALRRNGNGNGAGMKWWHWGLIGVAVLGGGYALTRVLAR